jgi:hypothetical protein
MASLVQTCPVCATSPAEVAGWGPLVRVKCPRCGSFALADALYYDLAEMLKPDEPLRASLMSHTLSRSQMQHSSRVITIDPSVVETYWRRGRLPTPQEQANDLILWIGDNQPSNTTGANTREVSLDAWIGAALPQVPGNAQGLRWLVAAMEQNPNVPKLFFHRFANGAASFNLTLEGWERYAALKQVNKESRTAFMAMKFGDGELNNVVDRCFRPAVQRTGFELRVLTDNQRAGLIDDQIRSALLSARFVVADLTHGSFGAYWEAGFADGRGLPVIYTCRRAEWNEVKTHFDTNHMTTVIWDVSDLQTSQDQMASIIRATLRSEAKQTDD